MRIEDATADSNWVLQYPIGIIEKDWEYSPILDEDWNVQTDKRILDKVKCILSQVEPDVLSLINVWFRNTRQEMAEKVDKVLEQLHKTSYNKMFDFIWTTKKDNWVSQISQIDNWVIATRVAAF